MTRAGARLRPVLPVRPLLVGLLALAGVLLAVPAPAGAHAVVVSTTPAHGSEVDEAPSAVTVVFDEPVSVSDTHEAVQVIDGSGERADAGEASLDASGTVLTLPLTGDLPDGVYVASWRVVSADTHVVGGSVQFGVGAPARAPTQGVAEMPDPALALVGGAAKGVVYLGLVLLLGLLPAALVLRSGPTVLRRVRALAEVGAVVTVLASLVQLWVQFLSSLPPGGGPIDLSGAARSAVSGYALAVWLRLAGIAVVLAALGALCGRPRLPDARAGRRRRGGAVVPAAILGAAGVLVVGSVVVNGHGGAGGVLGLGFVTTLAHAAAAIAWLGGLVLLGMIVLRVGPQAEKLGNLSRWSVYAAVVVGVLALTGAVQAISRVGFPEALAATAYGRVLLVKLAAVAAALLLAAVSLRRVGGAASSAGSLGVDPSGTATGTGSRALSRTGTRTRREAGLVAVAVLASGVLSSLTPAREDWKPTAEASADIGPYTVRVDIAPARVGPQSLRVTVVPPAEHFAQPETLEVTLRAAGGGAGPLTAEMPYRLPAPRDPGHPTPVTFLSAAVGVPAPGTWIASLTIVVSTLEQYTGEMRYEVR